MPVIRVATDGATDKRSNFEKLDDAGLLTDVGFAEHREALDALPSEIIDEIIEAFNVQEIWRQTEDRRESP